MKIFVTGATGVIGRRAIPLLLSRGHAVTALARQNQDLPTEVHASLKELAHIESGQHAKVLFPVRSSAERLKAGCPAHRSTGRGFPSADAMVPRV